MAPRPRGRRALLNPVALLAGRWTVRRALHDHARDVHGDFAGVAVFEPEDGGLRWTERGTMRFGAHDGPAWRELRIVPAGDGWEVRFADGRRFHPLELTGAEVRHPCGEDLYAGRYVLETPDRLRVRWRVSGPDADESLDATYERELTGPPRPA